MKDREAKPFHYSPVPLRAPTLRKWLGAKPVQCLLLCVLGFIVRMPALQGLPIWDDDYLMLANPFAKSPLLIPEAFRHYLFLDSFSYHYRPVQNISFVLDYFIWNTAAYGFHLTNVLLHVGSGALLFLLLCRLLPPFFGNKGKETAQPSSGSISVWAFLIALLWIVHPVHSAAVDYISGRADSLAFLFAAGAWLIYLTAGECRSTFHGVMWFAGAALSAMLALCSREIAAVWVALFLLHTFFFNGALKLRVKLVTLVFCLGLLGSYAALRHLPDARPAAPATQGYPVAVRSVLMLRALGDYGRLLVYPSTLYMDRSVLEPQNYLSNREWRRSAGTEYLSLLGAFVLASLIYGMVRKGRGRVLRNFGALWFLGGYLPISNLFDLNATVAEHWLYLPSVGFFIFAAGCVLDLPRLGRQMAVVLALFAAGGFGIRAYVRSTDWVTPKTFYQRTLAAGGTSTRIAVNLGMIYMREGDYAKAEPAFRRVLALVPDYPVARNALAEVLYRQGKHSEGEALFATAQADAPRARTDYPRTWVAALNLAYIRHGEHDEAGALALLDRARADYPCIWELIRYEAELMRETRGPEAALGLVAAFSRDNWWHHEATITLGRLLAEKGDAEGAIEQLRFASWLDVHDAEALRLIAAIRLRQNLFEEARVAQTRAVARQPDEPSQYRVLSNILRRMGRNQEADAAVQKVAMLEAVAKTQVAVN